MWVKAAHVIAISASINSSLISLILKVFIVSVRVAAPARDRKEQSAAKNLRHLIK